MKHTKSIETFRNEFYQRFPTKNWIKILKFLENRYVLVKDNYGECSMYRSNLLKGDNPSILTAIDKLQYYKNQFYSKFPNSDIKILNFSEEALKSSNYKPYILIETKYGICKIFKDRLLEGALPTFASSINAFNYLSNQIEEKHKDLELLEIKDNGFIIIKTKYGVCKLHKNDLTRNRVNKPSIKSAINKTEYFINQAKEVCGNEFDYSLVEYKNITDKVKIICKKHGIFEQSPNNHLQKQNGCKECIKELLRNSHPERFNTHKSSEWFKQAKVSKNFDSFKVYVIECWNENERFYKIGKTFVKLKNRFASGLFLKYYKYKILKYYELKDLTIESSQIISNLEKQLQKLMKENKYKPKFTFGGWNECYYKIDLQDIISVLENKIVKI